MYLVLHVDHHLGQPLLEEREERGHHDCPTRLTASSGVILGADTNAGVGKGGGRWACLGSSRGAVGNGASMQGNGDF